MKIAEQRNIDGLAETTASDVIARQDPLASPSKAILDLAHRILRSDTFPFRALLLAPLLVFAPILFGGYTLSQNPIGTDTTHPYGAVQVLPVSDPAGSALMEEPYLREIRQSLATGHVPVLNMKNGLGAVGVESLLQGTFYILDPLLTLLPAHNPLYFDIFSVAHVYILLLGLYFFLRHYAPPAESAAVSILVALSGVTYIWINMDHFRAFVWLPMMLGSTVGIARNERLTKYVPLLALAIVGSTTTGNVQETATHIACVFLFYVLETTAAARRRPVNGLVFLLVVAAGLLIASVAFLPFLISLVDGNLWATMGPDRSVRGVEGVWLFNWILPRALGYYPYLLLPVVYWPQSDLSTVACFLLLLGTVCGVLEWSRGRRGPGVAACIVLPSLVAIGLAKVVHFGLFDFFQRIPLVQTFLFNKYYLYLFVLASVPMAVGLNRIVAQPPESRKRLVSVATVAIVVALVLVVTSLVLNTKYAWLASPLEVRRYLLLRNYGPACAIFAATSWVLYRLPRYWQPLLISMFVLQSALLFPCGFGTRASSYPMRYDTYARSGERVLMQDAPSTNLFFGVESIGTFDCVVNRHYRDFMVAFFDLVNYGFLFQPKEAVLSRPQVRALQLVGTTAVLGYGVNAPDLTEPIDGGYHILNALPRAFILSPDTYAALKSITLTPSSIEGVVEIILKDVNDIPQPTDIRVDRETVRFNRPAGSTMSTTGILVVNQAYSTYWRYAGSRRHAASPGTPFLGLWPSWPLVPETMEQEVTYWPRGLTAGIYASTAGVLLLASVYGFVWRRARRHGA
jgi:hypothetical protein